MYKDFFKMRQIKMKFCLQTNKKVNKFLQLHLKMLRETMMLMVKLPFIKLDHFIVLVIIFMIVMPNAV